MTGQKYRRNDKIVEINIKDQILINKEKSEMEIWLPRLFGQEVAHALVKNNLMFEYLVEDEACVILVAGIEDLAKVLKVDVTLK